MPSGGNRISLAGVVSSLSARFRQPAKPRDQGKGAPILSYTYGGPAVDITQFAPVFQPSGGIFSPGYPLVPPQPGAPRRFDFPQGWNFNYRPRAYEPIGFPELRALADNHDLTRLAIETRKDQVEALPWQIKPRDQKTGKGVSDARIDKLTEFWLKPDGYNPFGTWLRMLLEDLFVIDAPACEVRFNRVGDIIGLDPIDGATIKVLLDDTGRRPRPPAPAYEQVIHGRPWVLLEDGERADTDEAGVPVTDRELIYRPRNPRTWKGYGFGPVEQILITVNIGLRRQTKQLQHYTEGNIPPGIINTPDGWTPDQVKQTQDWWDAMLAGNPGQTTKIVWVPANSKYQSFIESPYKDAFDEWIARIICYAFSLPPTAFVQQVNRATAETALETARDEGLTPILSWFKRFADYVIQERQGFPDLEFAWQEETELDPAVQQAVLTGYVKEGIYLRNEARHRLGLDPIEGGDVATVDTASGPILVSEIGKLPPPPSTPLPGAAAGEGGPGGTPETKPVAGEPPQPNPKPGEDGQSETGKPETGKVAGVAERGALPFLEKRRITPAPGRNARSIEQARSRLSEKLGSFFQARAAHIAEQIDAQLHKLTDEERAAAILALVDLGDWSVLISPTAEELAAIYADGVAQALPLVGLAAGETINEARGKFGLPPVASGDVVPAIAGDVSERAVYWANSRAASLVQQIEGNTRGMLSASVVEAIGAGLAGAALVSAIADSAAFSEARVDSIATTELLGASNAGNLAVFTGSNVATGKRWVTMDDDDVEEICQDNEDAGVIGLNDSFPSGHLAPLAHPNCRCYLEAAFIDPDAVSAVAKSTRRAISMRDLLIGKLQLRKARAGDRPVDLPVADEDTRIQVDHIAWQRVQSPDFVLIDGVAPMADLVATQDIVDGTRVDRYAEIYRDNPGMPPFDRPPIVLEHEGSAMILDGHHRVAAAKQTGAISLCVAFLEEDEPPGPSFDWTELEYALAPLAAAGRE